MKGNLINESSAIENSEAEADYKRLFELMYVAEDQQWREYNGPYFPFEEETYETFYESKKKAFAEGRLKLIDVNGAIIGTVNYYWEYQPTRWLEAGIVIYDSTFWNVGYGTEAFKQWITELFANDPEIARVGFTTWSGNPGMMKIGEKLGMMLEARLRKVRYHRGTYYDQIRYGVLREEWKRR
uniref:Acetyltransferase n=1 Tax=Halalkalibacterium halodurans TaxID=86665 RepID=A0A0M0KN58_ALKHA